MSVDTSQKFLIAVGLALTLTFGALAVIASNTEDTVGSGETGDPGSSVARSRVTEDASPPRSNDSTSPVPERRTVARTSAPRRSVPVTLEGAIPDGATVEEIISLLVLPDLRTNPRAVEALLASDDPHVIDRLLDRLGSGDSPLDHAIVDTLGHLRDLRVVPVVASFRRSGDPRMRVIAIDSLARLGGAEARRELLTHATEGPPEDRRHVVSSLGSFRHPGVSETVALYLDGDDLALRREAAAALGRIGDRTVVPTLETYLDDDDRYVRRSVIEALGEIGDPRSVDSLRRVATQDVDRGSRKSAVEALGRIGNRNCLPALQNVVDEGDEWLSEFARQAMIRIEERHPG